MMRKLRGLALLLCLTVLLSACAMPSLPFLRGETEEEELTRTAEGGSFGIYMTWTLTDEHTLHISGRGAIPDYWGDTTKTPNWPAWHEYCASVTTLVIEEGVSSIGDRAFMNCEKLDTVMLPTSLIEIGASAFENCASLQEINIPETVTSIVSSNPS